MDAIAPGPCPTNQPTNKDGGGRKCNCEFLGRLTYVHGGVGFHLIRFHCSPGKELCVCWQLIKNNIPTIQFFLLCGGVLLSTLTILISFFTLCHLNQMNIFSHSAGGVQFSWPIESLRIQSSLSTIFLILSAPKAANSVSLWWSPHTPPTNYVCTTCHVHWTIITFTFYNTPVVWGCPVEIGQGLLNCKTLIRLK